MPIPITVFTGFLGSGKTTTLLSLLPQLPEGYRAVLLKNEFGDVQVDSQLAKQSSLASINEILNGCMCCILVGQMKNALLEIKEKFSPDRILIETSGSAFPATLAFQINELERETNGGFKLDGIVTVIDAENFCGYEDTSVTAKMQAQYTDLLLINKWELVSERQLDTVMDHLFTLNESTPKLKCNGKNGVSPSLIFGLDSKLWTKANPLLTTAAEHNEVDVLTLRIVSTDHKDHEEGHVHSDACSHPLVVRLDHGLTRARFETALSLFSKEVVYRVKGFVSFVAEDGARSSSIYILNWAFGRINLVPFKEETSGIPEEKPIGATEFALLTVMGERGEVKRATAKIVAGLR